jgi:hypothetical protein
VLSLIRYFDHAHFAGDKSIGIPEQQFKELPSSVQEVIINASIPVVVTASHTKVDTNNAPPDSLAFRWDWGNHHGVVDTVLTFNGFGVTSSSLAFASASECRPGGTNGGTFIGDAVFEVFNVAVFQNTVSVRLLVDFPADLRVCVDYFIVLHPSLTQNNLSN